MNLSDLQIILQIIDLAAERGLFKGPDLKTVGEVRERVVAFARENTPEGAANAGQPTE